MKKGEGDTAYKGLMRQIIIWKALEYGNSVWDPCTLGLREELEKVQRHGRNLNSFKLLCMSSLSALSKASDH